MIRKYFHILKGEFRKVILMQLSIFLIISSLLILKPTFTSLFLTEHGVEQLPYVYILIAFMAVVVNMALSFLSEKKSLIKVIALTHLINIGVFLGMYYLIYNRHLTGWLSTGALVYVSIYALVITTQFWLMISEILNIRDAKRLIGLIGAGAIAGGIFGGYMTSVLVNHIGNAGMILVVSGILGINLFITLYINRQYRTIDISNELHKEHISHSRIWHLFERPHVRNIAMVIGLGVVVSRLVDFHFNYMILEIPRSSEELTSFLGFWFSTINVIGFLIQLILTSNIISRLGMERSMYFLPAGTLSMVLIALIFPGLTTAILLKSNDGALKQSIYKSSYELSLMPLHETIKSKVKYLIDIVVDSLATGISGIILLTLMAVDAIPIQLIIIINIILCLAWIHFVKKAGHTYHQTFIQNIKKIAPDGSIVEDVEIRNVPDDINELKKLLKNSSDIARQKILESFSNKIKHRKNRNLQKLLNDDSDLVSIAAYKVGLELGLSYVKLGLKYDRSTIKQKFNILEAVSSFLPDNKELQEQIKFNQKIGNLLDEIENSKTQFSVRDHFRIMKIITNSKSYNFYSYIRKCLNDDISVELKKAAIKACGFGTAKSFGNDLVSLIGDPVYEEEVKSTLARFKRGYIRYFRQNYLHSNKVDERLIIILSRIETQESIDTLFDLIDQENSKIRGAALRALNIMRERNPNLIYRKILIRQKINQEINSLKKLYLAYFSLINYGKAQKDPNIEKILNTNRVFIEGSILRIFIFLGLIHDKKNIDRIYRALMGKNKKNKNYALDFLDEILSFDYKRKLIPLFNVDINQPEIEGELKKANLQTNLWRPGKAFSYLYQFKDKSLNDKLLSYAGSSDDPGIFKWAKSLTKEKSEGIGIRSLLKKVS